MKFDHAMWTLAIALAILNGSGVIAISWWWVASPVILIFGLAAIYWFIHLLWMDWVETRAAERQPYSHGHRGDLDGENANQLIVLVAAFAVVFALLAVWVDKREAGKREAEAREEAAIMAKYGIEPQTWEYMTPEEKALFKR